MGAAGFGYWRASEAPPPSRASEPPTTEPAPSGDLEQAPSAASVTIGGPDLVYGGIPMTQARRVILQQVGALTRCGDEALARGTRGIAYYKITISPGGTTTGISPDAGDVLDRALDACVEEALGRAMWEGPTSVTVLRVLIRIGT